ncbi:Exopolyphosphatase [Blyttiomyces sp. JEL0837]|nr:Exopolyphosphatase [Blyttiomyces sp. JEL0837]
MGTSTSPVLAFLRHTRSILSSTITSSSSSSSSAASSIVANHVAGKKADITLVIGNEAADDLDFTKLQQTTNLSFVLTDHNQLAPSLERFKDLVVGVIDHHNDMGGYQNVNPRIIKPIGSATSLVVGLWKNANSDVGKIIDAEFARLMLCPILLDTINLDEKFGRVKEDDVVAGKFLMDLIMERSTASTSREEYLTNLFNNLQSAKFDSASLSNRDLLRKDYKETNVVVPGGAGGSIKFGISSVTWFLGDKNKLNNGWISREPNGILDIRDSVARYAEECHLDIAVVMTAYNHQDSEIGFQRELLVYSRTGSGTGMLERVCKGLEAEAKLELVRLGRVGANGEEGDGDLVWYLQRNSEASRKVLQPVLERVVKSLDWKH